VTDSRDNNYFRTDLSQARHQTLSDSRGANIEKSFHNRLAGQGTTQVVLCPAASKAMSKRRVAPPAWHRVKPVCFVFLCLFVGDDRGFQGSLFEYFRSKSGDNAAKRIGMIIGAPGDEQRGVVSQIYAGNNHTNDAFGKYRMCRFIRGTTTPKAITATLGHNMKSLAR
jgi:hypothetical protein